jgi:hypothetical protein
MKNKWILLVIILIALMVNTSFVLAESRNIFYEYAEKIDCGYGCEYKFTRIIDIELNIVCYRVGTATSTLSCLHMDTE